MVLPVKNNRQAREVTPGGWTLQPDGVAIDHSETGEDAAEKISDQRRVEIPQIARADQDRGHQQQRGSGGNQCGAKVERVKHEASACY